MKNNISRIISVLKRKEFYCPHTLFEIDHCQVKAIIFLAKYSHRSISNLNGGKREVLNEMLQQFSATVADGNFFLLLFEYRSYDLNIMILYLNYIWLSIRRCYSSLISVRRCVSYVCIL